MNVNKGAAWLVNDEGIEPQLDMIEFLGWTSTKSANISSVNEVDDEIYWKEGTNYTSTYIESTKRLTVYLIDMLDMNTDWVINFHY